jgi:hypothetical protein
VAFSSVFFSGKKNACLHLHVFFFDRPFFLHMQAEGFEEELVVSTAIAELDPMWRRRGNQNMNGM